MLTQPPSCWSPSQEPGARPQWGTVQSPSPMEGSVSTKAPDYWGTLTLGPLLPDCRPFLSLGT